MKIINIVDTGCDRYTIKSDCYCLGRQWDNLAEQIQVVKPKGEEGNVCTMVISVNGIVIDHWDIKEEPKDITNVLSRFPIIEISFVFTNESGYVKSSETKTFYFEEARKPENFVPVEPEQSSKLDILLGNGFTGVELVDKMLKFYNANGDLVKEVELPTSQNGDNSIIEETDPTVPAWAKEENKPTYTFQEIQDKPVFSTVATTGSYKDLKDQPSIPSVAGLASESYVNNKANAILGESKSYTDTQISNLVGSAPSTLDTIAEIATALNNNPNVVTALNNLIASKQNATDNNLNTTSKTIVGAINEINSKISSANTQLQNILGV